MPNAECRSITSKTHHKNINQPDSTMMVRIGCCAWGITGAILLLVVRPRSCHGLASPSSSNSNLSMAALRTAHATTTLPKLQRLAPSESGDVAFLLRFCTCDDPEQALRDAMKWRTSPTGADICASAKLAVSEAMMAGTAGGNKKWDNDPVFARAPYAKIIGQYITPANCITTTSRSGQLVYCIRAGSIDDKKLMSDVTIDQLVDFFLYVKEVNWQVANLRSSTMDENAVLQTIITCNDLAGVKLLGGSADFRTALSKSSKLAATIYPGLAGPTLLLNLPTLLSALVQLFTPLFPESVKARLKFAQGPLKDVSDLRQIASSSTDNPVRRQFLDQLETALQS
jgi:CRAL/TRIO domain